MPALLIWIYEVNALVFIEKIKNLWYNYKITESNSNFTTYIWKISKRSRKWLRSEHYDRVYIIGHSLGEADYAVLDAINKDAKVIYFYHSENECSERLRLLRDFKLEFEMIKDT